MREGLSRGTKGRAKAPPLAVRLALGKKDQQGRMSQDLPGPDEGGDYP